MRTRRFLTCVVAGMVGAVSAATALRAAGHVSGPPPLPPASAFVARVDNPWFPLVPGTTYVYRGAENGKPTHELLTVTHATIRILGVRCTVVRDLLYVQGRLAERTHDWYAQDAKGNVWYFGEATEELDASGKVTTTEGSWQAGRDGARPGIQMPAQPRIGVSLLQEYYRGHAEDEFRVLNLHASIRVPLLRSTAALLTQETSPLEPGVVDHKYYVRGIGTVLEQSVRGGAERSALVAVRRP